MSDVNSTLEAARKRISSSGRNERCPCGSGQKYKHCCLPADEEAIQQLGIPGRYANLRQAAQAEMSGFIEWLAANGYAPAVRELSGKNLELLFLLQLQGRYIAEARQKAMEAQQQALNDPHYLEQLRANRLAELEQIDKRIVEARKAKEAETTEE
jgi:hypothetical protein